MRIIDFRSRPNTDPFMSIYDHGSPRNPWAKFKTERPATESLDQYLDRLREADVHAAVFTGRQGVLAGDHPISNDYIAECVKRAPGCIYGMAGIDPRDTEAALGEIDRVVNNLQLTGLSFDPPSSLGGDGPSWDDETLMFPLFERAQDLGVPVVLTLGPIVGRHGSPTLVDRVAEAFPELTLICSHGVWPQTAELVALAFRRPNVILETSIYFDYPGAAATLVQAANELIQDQIVYASAFPFVPLEMITEFLNLGFSDETLTAICYTNAARILGID